MRARWVPGLAVTIGLTAAGLAHATTIGGLTTKSIEAWNQSGGVGAPEILTCDSFALSAPTGSALNNRPVRATVKCGPGVWTVQRGTWTISSGQLAASGGGAIASINAGQSSMSAEATILNANGSSRQAGVVINHTAGTRTFLVGELSGPSTARLRLSNAGALSTLASASVTITATTIVRITRSGATVTVSVNGVLALTYTLTSAQQTTLGTGERVGLFWNSGSAIRFTNVLGTTVSAP